MARKYGFTRLPLIEAVEQDRAHPDPGWGRSELFGGPVPDALDRWLQAFPDGQVKVLLNEELDDPATWSNLAKRRTAASPTWTALKATAPVGRGGEASTPG